MISQLSHIKNKLSEAHLKATHQRLVILEALTNTPKHPTAEHLFEMIRPQNPSLSLGTVYKTLDVLVAAGLVRKVSTTDSSMHYDANLEEHSHIYLEDSQEIVDFEDKELLEMIQQYLSKKQIKNLEIKEIQVQIKAQKLDPKAKFIIE